MKKLAIIHTTPATLDPLKSLANEILPGCELVNFVDDSILPQLAKNGGNIEEVAPRFLSYASFAEQVGADIILSACSSVGELVERARQEVKIPVVRIDEAMAEEAVCHADRLGVAATLATTLNPTTRLLHQKAETFRKKVEIEPVLVEAAYQRLMAGDKDGHDEILSQVLTELAGRVEAVVLAQASMARVLPLLPENQREKFYTSPRLGMLQVEKELIRRYV